MVSALTLAQAAGGGGLNLDTGTVVAVVGAVLAALVSLFGLRLGARLAAIEKGQEGLVGALDRLERRLDDGLARLTDRFDRLTDRIDRLYRDADEISTQLVREQLEQMRLFREQIEAASRGQDEEEREQ